MTSPVKPGHSQTRGARAVQKRLKEDDAVFEVSPEDFLYNYLPAASQQPEAERSWKKQQQTLVDTIRGVAAGREMELYTGSQPLIRLCNSVSTIVSKSLKGHKTKVAFYSHHDKTLADPLESSLKPDIIVTREEVHNTGDRPRPGSAREFTWFNIAAVGEAKVRDPENERYQTGSYLRKHLQLRPELHSVIGFSADTKGYSLYYHDASVIHQCSVGWENALLLYAFVRQLHQGTPCDPSIVNLRPEERDPSWLVKIEEDLLLITSATPDPGLGQRRFTAMATDMATGDPRFIKDFYPDIGRRFDEGLLYAKAHEGKMLPGLMRAIYHGHPLDTSDSKLTTTNFGNGPSRKRIDRWKKRIATGDVGEPLSKVSSLLEFLKIMYDACVVQRNLHRKGILHRDISENNIMMAPKDNGRYHQECVGGYDEVKYLNQVLKPEEPPQPACLVIDLGHGADLKYLDSLPDSVKDSRILAGITGTPKFISRSASKGELLEYRSYKPDKEKLPRLNGRAHDLYTLWAADYNAYNEAVSKGGQSLSELLTDDTDDTDDTEDTDDEDDRPSSRPEFRQQLFHDAESTFWVIAWFLARSAPTDYKAEEELDKNKKLVGFLEAMEFHVPGKETDTRADLRTGPETWKQILHPRLADVAPMLSGMHRYILPEWGYRPDLGDNHPEHAHEALMRLLLRYIVRIDDDKTKDVVFAPAGTRVLPIIKLPINLRSTTISTTLAVPSTSISTIIKKRSRSLEDDGAELGGLRRSKRLQVKSPGGGDQAIPVRLIADAQAHSWAGTNKCHRLEAGTHLFPLPTTPPVPQFVVQV